MTLKLFIFSILFVTLWLDTPGVDDKLSAIHTGNKETIARQIVINLSNQDFEAATAEFTDTLKQQLTPLMLRGPWMSIVANAGAFKAIISTEGQKIEGVDQVVIFCQFENANAVVQVIFNLEEKVTGLYLKPA